MLDFLEKYPYIKSYLLPISIGTIGLFLIILGLLLSLKPQTTQQISYPDSQSIEETSSARLPTEDSTIDPLM